MGRILPLAPSVVNQIAAGEVIERPASVVKELLENAVDSGATQIDVDIAAGGSELIRVVDNGGGIHPDDLPLAVLTHATSKIQSADDLFSIHTMGFRGEALASIAEISEFRIRSRQPDAVAGAELAVRAGAAEPVVPCGCPVGTSVEVRQLFTSTPVRRKFLKAPSTEFGHISDQFARIAIARPRLGLTLRHNDKVVFDLPATDDLQDRLRLFFGDETAEQLLAVESNQAGVRMWGYVGHPSVHKSTRKSQHLFLNGRWIQDRTLQHALTEAYRGLLMVGRQPIAFLFLEMDPQRVDVNVHPTKAEVRFQDPQQLYRQLLAMVRSKFLSLDLQSELKLPGAAALDASPLRETQRTLQDDFATWAKGELLEATSAALPRSAVFGYAADTGARDDWTSGSRMGRSDEPSGSWPNDRVDAEPLPRAEWTGPADSREAVENEAPRSSERDEEFGGANGRQIRVDAAETASSAPERGPFGGAASPTRALQIHDCYLVVETPAGLTVIDQHALHERILYERFRERVLSRKVESQRLLVPQPVEASPKDAALLLEHAALLAELGFGVEEFGLGTVLVTQYPVLLGRVELTQLVRDLAEKLESGGTTVSRRDILDTLLHMLACKAAVKAGQRLTPEEMESLLAQRDLVDDAHHCPHGRPTSLTLSRSELDRQFGRLG